MSQLSDLVRRVITGTITPTQVLTEVRDIAPLAAAWNRSHPWWLLEGEAILETIISVSQGRCFLSPRAAVNEAMRINGKVVDDRIAGVVFFKVLPLQQADEVVTQKIVSQAMPAEFVEPTWDSDLPTLSRFRSCAETEYLRRLLTKNTWNLSAAAREAGVPRQTLYALLKKHGLTRPGSTIETSTETDVAQAA